MNLLDLLIIYLACGAPFGVIIFVKRTDKNLYACLQTLGWTLCWPVPAFKLLHSKVTNVLRTKRFVRLPHLDSLNDTKLLTLRKTIESDTFTRAAHLSLFEVREVIDRYVGLLKLENEQSNRVSHTNELYEINRSSASEVSAICLNRINRNKIQHHLDRARNDFLDLANKIAKMAENPRSFQNVAIEFVRCLDDKIAISALNCVEAELEQTVTLTTVTEMEEVYGKS